MLIKIAGMIMVIAASSALGMYFSGMETYRIQDLLEFKKALLMLTSEIEFVAAPLQAAMQNIANRTAKPVSRIFEDFAQKLSDGGETVYQLWVSAIEEHKAKSYLTAEDWDVLLSFGKTLGYLDKPMQINTINFTLGYIDTKVSHLQVNCDKNKRMYRSLGVIGGILLAVIFI